jgi:cysteinyl-tRNA synthetase
MLQIYNSLSKKKETFKPIVPPVVGLYVCGVTVYDYCHIGHARTYLAFDMIQRYLLYRGYRIKYVRNITDIDDKIIQRAEENNERWQALTERFIKAMYEDLHDSLNTLKPTLEPKATEFVPQMIKLIEQLIAKGYAYQAANNDVYFEVGKFSSYGCLAHRDLEDLVAGSRVEINEAKRNPLDFVLWKSAKPNEPSWDSPFGKGRPGWHTECAAMSIDLLGETFDIHGGGPDLKFPHHENERAQSEAITEKTFVNTWMHVGYLQIEKEKMSKSMGNFITIRDFLTQYHPEVLRYFNIASHYRSPIEYAREHMEIAQGALLRLYTALRGLKPVLPAVNTHFEARFIEAMDDDFNTPVALSVLFDLVRELNRERDINLEAAEKLGALLKKLGNVLGILFADAEEFLQGRKVLGKEETQEIETLVAARTKARENKEWNEADRIRKLLTERGVELEDTAAGTLWRKS